MSGCFFRHSCAGFKGTDIVQTVTQPHLSTSWVAFPLPLLPHCLLLPSQWRRIALQAAVLLEAFRNNFHNSCCFPHSPCDQLFGRVLCNCGSHCLRSSELGTPLRFSTMSVLCSVYLRFCTCTFLLLLSVHLHSTAFRWLPRLSCQAGPLWMVPFFPCLFWPGPEFWVFVRLNVSRSSGRQSRNLSCPFSSCTFSFFRSSSFYQSIQALSCPTHVHFLCRFHLCLDGWEGFRATPPTSSHPIEEVVVQGPWMETRPKRLFLLVLPQNVQVPSQQSLAFFLQENPPLLLKDLQVLWQVLFCVAGTGMVEDGVRVLFPRLLVLCQLERSLSFNVIAWICAQSTTDHHPGLLQNQSLEIIQACIVVLCSDITILSVLTCVMNVRDQTRQAFVASFCPFCDRTSKLVHGPQNIRSPNTNRIQTFENNLWADCRQFSL